MSDFTVPSYRIRPQRSGFEMPWRLVAIAAGGVAVLGALGAGGWYLLKRGSGPVPTIEADNRPIRVRPTDAGGLRVANQDERIFDAQRRGNGPAGAAGQAPAQGGGQGAQNAQRLAPDAERPDVNALRQAAQNRGQQQAAAPAPRPGQPAPAAPQQAAPQAAPLPNPTISGPPAGSLVPLPSTPAPQPPATAANTAQPAAAPPPARPVNPRIVIQLGALGSEEAARNEWNRLRGRVPELADRQPTFPRYDRGADQAPVWRIRTNGFPDADAARAFCEGVRQKNAPCTVVGG